jgi:hypothetical protein
MYGPVSMAASNPPQFNVEWSLIADYAMVDQTGKLSLIGIFNRLWAPVFPSMQPVVFLVSAWAGEPNRAVTSELRIWGPSKELIVGGQQPVQLGPDGRANGIYRLSPLPLPTPGTYTFELMLEGVSAAHVPLPVEQMSQPPIGQT